MRDIARTLGTAFGLLLAPVFAGPAGAATPVVGSFTYSHPAPVPLPGRTLLPVPGAAILLVQGTFKGDSNLGPFTGEGAFLFDTSSFSYTGEFRWDFAGGSLRGNVSGQDYPVETPDGYLTTMVLTFTGGTGWFRGAAGLGATGGTDHFDPEGTSAVRAVFTGTLLAR